MSPRRIETLIQRVGRAGHRLDQLSRGIIIAETPRDLLESYLIKKLVSKGKVEPTFIHPFALDILFHSIIGILLDFGETTVKKILKIIRSSFLYKDFTPQNLIPLLEYGRENHFFFINKDPNTNKISLRVKRKAYRYYYSNLSSIPTKKTYSVIDVGTQKRVGQLDESFVITRGEKGTVFILNGLPWEFLAQKDEGARIEVKQVKATDAIVTETAKDLFSEKNLNSHLSEESASIRKELLTFIEEQKEREIIPTKKEVLIETAGRQVVLHSFLGSKGNETLGLILSSILGAKQGHSVEYRSDPYSIFMSLARPASLKSILESFDPQHISPLLHHRIKSSDLFTWRIRHVAKRFGALSESVQSSPVLAKLLRSRYEDTIIGEETINEILAEKMDMSAVIDFFTQLHQGALKIKEIPVKRFDSPLSRAATEPISLNVLKLRPSHIILEKIEKRIRNTWVKLVCMRLGCKFEKIQRVESMNEIIQCPECRSRYIAVVHRNKTGIKGLLKRSVDVNSKLSREEKKELGTAKKSADIVLSFGKRAAFILAGRGIGPTTAIRILRAPQKDTEDLLTLIYKYEADFARTREYWE
jgi:ATP-dependent Lhr-like helicase